MAFNTDGEELPVVSPAVGVGVSFPGVVASLADDGDRWCLEETDEPSSVTLLRPVSVGGNVAGR